MWMLRSTHALIYTHQIANIQYNNAVDAPLSFPVGSYF